mmetsp:Transcript_6606/g.7352  ORF Transcript_6606/g.7352 Transcript_6606/m.7352 type:complete len:406 (-) Transcript_6606:42-1259(-)
MGCGILVEPFFHDVLHWSTPATPDSTKTIAELIMTAGYQFETHKIVTEDQYINTAWRIVGKIEEGEFEDPPEKKPCVILQHGLLDNSATWLIPNATTALPYMLVDEGYDVWMTNSRGNINSYEHMNPAEYNVFDSSSKFFDFSWDEMGKYDVTANLNYVISHSNYDKAFYVGHSQGVTQFFVASDVISDLGDKIAGFIGLGPVMYVGNMYSLFFRMLINVRLLEIMEFFKFKNFLILPQFFSPVIRYIAMHFRTTLWRVIGLLCGVDKKIYGDLDRMPVMGNHEPGGTSIMNFIHWEQMAHSGDFAYYDHGSEKNIELYGKSTAPLYNTTHIAETFKKFPTFLQAGGNDMLVAKEDLEKLTKILENTDTEIEVIDGFGHLDYLWAKESKEVTFDKVRDFIKKNTI